MPRPPRPVIKPEDTRMQTERLKAEQQAEQQASAGRMSMASDIDAANAQDGVYDGQDGSLVEPALSPAEEAELAARYQLDDNDDIVESDDAQYQREEILDPSMMIGPNGTPILRPDEVDPDAIETARPTGSGRPVVAEAAPYDPTPAPLPEAVPVGAGGPRAVRRASDVERRVVVRINADVQPTIGQGPGNTWDFKAGRRYRVPPQVANHLAEKGYISQYG